MEFSKIYYQVQERIKIKYFYRGVEIKHTKKFIKENPDAKFPDNDVVSLNYSNAVEILNSNKELFADLLVSENGIEVKYYELSSDSLQNCSK